jgi:cytochrome c5
VDKDGIHENFPRNDREWTAAWAAAITLAESGNLLMMPERARADADWNTLALQLVEAGNRAAEAAEARNADLVLEQGEKVYEVCTACHMKFVMGGEVP